MSGITCCRIFMLLAAVLAAGCLPQSMKVHYGTQPEAVDEAVRFRTTYYFRVFDDCHDREMPEHGGLYRFRMTGKANSLTNKVKFESGILPAESIDPFGISLRYDESSDSLLFRSAQAEGRVRVAADLTALLERLIALRNAVAAQPGGTATKELIEKAASTVVAELDFLKKLQDPVLDRREYKDLEKGYSSLLELLKQTEKQFPADQQAELQQQLQKRLNAAFDEVVATVKGVAQGRGCARNDRGFLILGPEGWKQFEPNDRLIMAMYSSGRPLISTLNEISSRALRTEGNSPEAALVYAEQNSKIVEAMAELGSFTADDPQTAVRAITDAIEKLSAP